MSPKLISTVTGEFLAITKGVFTGTVAGKPNSMVMHGVFAFADMDIGFFLLGKAINFT